MKKNNSVKNINTQNNNFKFDEPYNKQKWAEHFGENFKEEYGSVAGEEEIIEKNKDFLNKIIWIGDLNINENEVIGVFEVYIKNTRLASRVKISRICSRILMSGSYGKGIFFILYEDNKNNYRVSYVKHDKMGIKGENGLIIMKDDYSNPKRYTFLLGEGIKVHTPASRITSDIFGSVESIENAFSVEGVNKEFYKGVKEYFEKIHNDIIKYFDKDENKAKEFALRFLGRVLFCWFLREKELIPNEILNSGVFENLKYKKNYYSDVLEDLFFNVLNMDMEKRKFSKERVIYNYEKAIPFLNGGLFSKKEDDEAVKSIDDEIIKGLFEFFEMYNFTVDESAPFDVEISIDPEMLGRIFENLLAEINPETKESARKETGSFYTPREIVDYMVMEAIKLYLYKKMPDMEKNKIDRIFDVDESVKYTDEERKGILKNIHDMIILDPACGSGAFPLGILQRVFNVIDKLDPNHEYYKNYVIDKLPSGAKAEFKKLYDAKKFSYAYKLDILQSMIHGVDIQPIAIEVSKLRAFLSLVVDEKKEKKEHNLGIRTLPNLEFQFLCTNALIGVDFNIKKGTFEYSVLEGIKTMMKNISEMFYVASSLEEKERVKIKFEEFREFVKNSAFIDESIKAKILSWCPFDNKSAEFFSPLVQFGIDRDFDIVIGNPPYIQLQGMAKGLKEMYQNAGYESFKSTGDIYQLFYEKCLGLLSDDGVASLITSNKWMRAGYGASTREYFYKNADVFRIIDLGAGRFESATVDVNIIFYSKTKEKHTRGERSFEGVTYSGSLKEIASAEFDAVVSEAGREWVIMSGLERSIFNKISRHKALKDWDIKINYGIKTGYNEAFIIDEETKDRLIKEDKKSAELIKPLLRGRDIKRYSYDFNNLYLICTFPALKLNIDKYKAIKKYLESFGKRLEQSGEKGCRKKTNNKWFETQDTISYYKDFENNKIIYPNMTKYLPFIYDENNFYVNQKCFFIIDNKNNKNNLKYLTGILNSKVSHFWIRWNCPELQGGTRELSAIFFANIPIPEADSKTKNNITKLVDQIIILKKQDKDTTALEKQIDEIVYSLYGLSDEEVKVVEG
ncbi:Eco57I restriction-modification methylase domain-containing protein [Brachyspira murdochii]|uniref:site-specific DNA-methyltransferase (adenine-specific) n=1 Tax=Brachyspira murdochii (strain ATCC 51284 / DSM 12563 / 56-150) TaxID=526224 RepID=D5U6B7_BRAM5|nr:TaqI-like C-terminal specificity domain-containing protein [Brachyspira murdochii]ADG72616.1 type IIS restriction endonuclease, putative [Brachyspira murdochii DSM 12563]